MWKSKEFWLAIRHNFTTEKLTGKNGKNMVLTFTNYHSLFKKLKDALFIIIERGIFFLHNFQIYVKEKSVVAGLRTRAGS